MNDQITIQDMEAYRRGWDLAYKAGLIGLISFVLSLLPFLIITSLLGGIGSLVAIIMFLIALNYLSRAYGDPSLFRLFLFVLILAFVGTIFFSIGWVQVMQTMMATGSDWQSMMGGWQVLRSLPDMGTWGALASLVLLIAMILQVVVYWKLGNYTGNLLFKVAAVLAFLGIGSLVAYLASVIEGARRRKEELPAV